MRSLVWISSLLMSGSLWAASTSPLVFYQEPATTPNRGTGLVGGGSIPRPAPSQTEPTAEQQKKLFQQRVKEMQAARAAGKTGDNGANPAGSGDNRADQTKLPVTAQLEHTNTPSGPGVKLNYKNAPIDEVINSIMQELGYSYVIDPQVQGTVNIFSMREIPRDKLFGVLEQLLKLNGLAIIKQDGYYVIVPINEGPSVPHEVLTSPPPTGTAPQTPSQQEPGQTPTPEQAPPQQPDASTEQQPQEASTQKVSSAAQGPETAAGPNVIQVESPQGLSREGVVTYVVPLNYIVSDDMLKMAQVFLSPGATVVDFAPANMLIITDYPKNIEQVLTLVDLLDTRYFELNTVDLLSIRFNKATDVAEDLAKIFAPGDTAAGVRIVAIERLNSILVVTRSPDVLAEVRKWVDKLDAPTSTSNIKTYVYQVENNTAVQIAQILAELYQGGTGLPSSVTGGAAEEQQGGQGAQASSLGQSRQAIREPGFVQGGSTFNQFGGGGYGQYGGYGGGYGGGGYGSYGGYGGYSGGYGGYGGGGGNALGTRLGPALSSASQSQIRSVYAGNVKIVVNEFNNSLIIQGTESDIDFILNTVKQLDTLPRQCVVEARIYSVELNNNLSFGVSAFLQARGAGAAAEGGSSVATSGSIGSGTLTATTRAIVGSEREIQAIITALKAKTDVEVLEAPRILTLDGTPASINIGGEVPVTSASYGNPLTSGTTNFINSIQYRPTGTTLLFVPRISASGLITMDVVLEVSSVAGGSDLTPTISRQYIQSSFLVQDGQSIGIAGLISDSHRVTKSRVPVLGDIPIVGALFGTTSNDKRRFELMIFITPKVIRNMATSAELTLEFKRAMKNAYQFIDKKEAEQKALIEKREKQAAEQPKPASDKPEKQ
ncbi:MAG: type II secretion system secretin GspD [Acidobacteriota bacterium]